MRCCGAFSLCQSRDGRGLDEKLIGPGDFTSRPIDAGADFDTPPGALPETAFGELPPGAPPATQTWMPVSGAASTQFEVVFETRPLRLGFRPEPRGLVVIDCSQRPDLALQNGDVITALNGTPTFGWASDSVPSHIAAMQLPIAAAVTRG